MKTDRVPTRSQGRDGSPCRVVLVTNIPAPYRIPVYERLDAYPDVALQVIYTAERERNRHWTLPTTSVRSTTLRSVVLEWRGRYIHFTRGVVAALRAARPDVVVTTGFNPPQLLAVAYAAIRRIPHVAQTDGTVASEERLTSVHRIIRRAVARRTAAFVAASESGRRLQRGYGAAGHPMFLSPLAVDNDRFADLAAPKDVDLLFAGQLSTVKDPLFALQVAEDAAAAMGRRVRIAFIGTGPLHTELEEAASRARNVDTEIAGFQQQDVLPLWYARSRVFLFPSHWDPWGLVANEAAAAGVPQVISPAAGAASELVRDGVEGFVAELDLATWTQRVVQLLDNESLQQRMGAAARHSVRRYSLDAAAEGLHEAVIAAARTARRP